MLLNSNFDKIRPFNDNEVSTVLNRLIKEPILIKFLKNIDANCTTESVNAQFQNIHSIKDFQIKFVCPLLNLIINQSTNGLTYTGIEHINHKESYLFISNHRDIILDSTFLNFILYQNDFDMTEIAIGSNLLIFPWINDFVRLNKSFIVKRNAPIHLMYDYSFRLSKYIRHTIIDKHTSIWIAQREGRTKDGNDKTQPSLLKMLSISYEGDSLENYKTLNIIPVSISYEYDPCDSLKVAELYERAHNSSYKKTPKDDLNGMFKGIKDQKGRVNLSFGKPINDNLYDLNEIKNKNEQIKQVALLIDKQIYENYKLWPNNYIAYDLLNNSKQFIDFYTTKEKESFVNYMNKNLKALKGDINLITELFLHIYANPVKNSMLNS